MVRDKATWLPEVNRDAVLFVDATRLGKPVPRRPNALTAADWARISDRFQEWRRSPRDTPDEPGFSRTVTHEEILTSGANLDPRTYVGIQQERSAEARPASSVLDDLKSNSGTVSRSGDELASRFSRCESLISSGIEVPRVPLERVVGGVAGDAGLLFAGPSGSLIRAKDYVDNGGTPVVMPRDLTDDGFAATGIKRIADQHAQRMARFRLRPGDVVLARRGELGKCAVVRAQHQGWICGTGCFVLRPPATLHPDYFAAYLRSREARAWLDAHSTGTVAMKTISLNALRELPVALPDLDTQYAIADVMIQLDEHERLLREQLALTREVREVTLAEFLDRGES
jgi:type I restriction enzyme M protein